MKMSYPLPITLSKLNKLIEKRLNPVIVWACDDGIIYAEATKLEGVIKRGGIPPLNDEMTVYYDKQKTMKYVRYV
jgi:hypothetical protein